MMSNSEIIAVVKAHMDGKPIQVVEVFEAACAGARWRNVSLFSWDFERYAYRVAPEPRKPREWEIIVLNGQVWPRTEKTVGIGELIRVREVID